MNHDYLLYPLTSYIFQAIGLGLCVWLWYGTKKTAAQNQAAWARQQTKMESTISELRMAVRQLEKKALEVTPEEPANANALRFPVLTSGMNLSKRGQALRMSRRGEGPSQIAAALGTPVSEIELLLKLHRTLTGVGAEATNGDRGWSSRSGREELAGVQMAPSPE
ncbi:MAG: hypothetical protein KJZ78_09855 [Bryobacteraceae bacterium]|nr:hypothetical protein [Bryobacteraceae bacterium]